MPFYERQPYIQPLHQIITEVLRGDIRVPRFQRPGTEATWRPEQRGDLLDSLYRGFPVGTILLWSTARSIRTLDAVGGVRIPPPRVPNGTQRLLLDGHQRLSTLVQVLGRGLSVELAREGHEMTLVAPEGDDEEDAPSGERWVFELDAAENGENSRERFSALKADQRPTSTQVPLDIVLNRSSLNRWIRVRETPLTDDQVAAADSLRDRLREYSMPIAVLATDSLKEATESFRRINSSGTPMSDFHMVAALAFETDYDLQQEFTEARAEHLAPIGWTDVPDPDVLRVCAGIENTNPVRLDVESLAARLRRTPPLVERTFRAIAAATQLLGRCGVHGPEALPYAWQLIALAVHLGRKQALATFSEADIPAAQRWFWLTTYGEVFAGGNSAVFDRSLRALDDMLNGQPWARMERDVTRQVRPVEAFDFRTARSKACALAMARWQDEDRTGGPAHRALAGGVDSMQLLFARGRRSRWWHLAVVTPEQDLSVLRETLRRNERHDAQEPGDPEILRRLGVDPEEGGSLEQMLAARRERLRAQEQQFVAGLGLTWAS